MPPYLEIRFHTSVNKNWLYINHQVPSSWFKGCWVYSSIATAKMLKKNLNYLNICLNLTNLQNIFWSKGMVSFFEMKPWNFANGNLKFLKYSKLDVQTQKNGSFERWDGKMVWNKLWIIISRDFKIKNKILSYDLIIFQIFWSYCWSLF